MKENLYKYILSIADNSLILGQRLGELCGHGPNLETDIACTNISLDLFGQVRSYYQYAASFNGSTEDEIAFLRKERDYRNVLLVEQPNTNFAHVIARQYLFDVYHLLFLEALCKRNDDTLKAIAFKSIKEVKYHVRFSGDWVKRLGDGTEISRQKIQDAFDEIWVYTDELFQQTAIEEDMITQGIGVQLDILKAEYYHQIESLLKEATLAIPESKWFQKGGKNGIHTEHLGYILSDLQYMQRTFPNMEW